MLGTSLGAAALVLAACGGGGTVVGSTAGPTTTPGATLSIESSPEGPILTTGTGHTLYAFANDHHGRSTCVSSICTTAWPPLLVHGTVVVAHGVKHSKVATTGRPDGAEQVTYGGHPLYTWAGDSRAGMVTGQALNNAGGLWYVVAPSGHEITTAFTVTG